MNKLNEKQVEKLLNEGHSYTDITMFERKLQEQYKDKEGNWQTTDFADKAEDFFVGGADFVFNTAPDAIGDAASWTNKNVIQPGWDATKKGASDLYTGAKNVASDVGNWVGSFFENKIRQGYPRPLVERFMDVYFGDKFLSENANKIHKIRLSEAEMRTINNHFNNWLHEINLDSKMPKTIVPGAPQNEDLEEQLDLSGWASGEQGWIPDWGGESTTQSLKNVADKVIPKAKQLIKKGSKAVKNINPAVKMGLTGAGAVTPTIPLSVIMSLLPLLGAGGSMGQGAADVGRTANESWNAIKNRSLNSVISERIGRQIGLTESNGRRKVKHAVSEQWYKDAWNTVTDAASEVGQGFSELGNDLFGDVGQNLADVGAGFGQAFDAVTDVDKWKTGLSDVGSGFKEIGHTLTGDMFREQLEALRKQENLSPQAHKQAIQDWTTSMKNKLVQEQHPDGSETAFGKAARNAAESGAEFVFDTVPDAVGDAASYVNKNVIQPGWDKTKEVASDVYSGAKNVASDVGNWIGSWFEGKVRQGYNPRLVERFVKGYLSNKTLTEQKRRLTNIDEAFNRYIKR